MPKQQPGRKRFFQGVGQFGDVEVDRPQNMAKPYNFTLSSAQILALFTTPIAITPTPAANYAFEIEKVVLWLVQAASPVAYASIHDFQIRYQNASGLQVAGCASTGFIDQTTAQNRVVYSYRAASGNSDITPVAAQPIVILIGTGNPTTGTGVIQGTTYYRQVATTPIF